MNENAQERRWTGETGAQITDAIDLLGVNHFRNLFESFFDLLFARGTEITDRARQQEKQAILNWAKEIRVLRDPMSHPSEPDLPYEDAFRMLDDARRILLKFDSESAEQVQSAMRSIQSPGATTAERSALEGYLPPAESITVNFVGRSDELKGLKEWFDDPTRKRWALMGDGGKGKTAIAYEFACSVKSSAPEPFQFVIWLSAKRQRFLEGSTVHLPRPDFSDLSTALSWILNHFGWGPDEVASDDRRDLCMQLLQEFPALLVVDDIDSLEGVDESAVEFFTVDVPTTRSKVLMTSRRKLTGLGATTTVVAGFDEHEGRAFIRSRVRLFGLDTKIFTAEVMRRILEITDGSPLFIEDLLRLCAFGMPVVDAISAWEKRGGDDARKYALGREFDLLSPNAQKVLIACSVPDGPVSLAEIEAVTNLSDEAALSAIEETQRLFLAPKPKLIEEVERFDLNINTRALVRTLKTDTDIFRRIRAGFQALTGQLPHSPYRSAQVSAYVRQAVGLVKQDRHNDAEKTLNAGLSEFPNDLDLLGVFGWLYKTWKPHPRVDEARGVFTQAMRLNTRNEDTFVHWSEMEALQREWTKAAEAADRGLKHRPNSRRLLFAAGYARSQLGRELLREFHQPRASDELKRARGHLKGALRPAEDLRSYQDQVLQARTYRALVLALETSLQAAEHEDDDRLKRGRQDLALEGLALLEKWRLELPADQNAETESWRLTPKFSREMA